MNVKNSLIYWCVSKFINLFNSQNRRVSLFLIILLYYLILWIISPNNKIIALSFLLLFALIYRIFKDLRVSVLLTYLSSTILVIGKTYLIQLVSPGIYDIQFYPNGYVLSYTISPSIILAIVMLIILLRDFFTKRFSLDILRDKKNVLIYLYFLLPLLSDSFLSLRPEVSLGFNLLNLSSFVLYFYLQIYIKNIRQFIPLLVSVFSAFILFESLIAFRQYIAKSPVGNNLEYFLHIDPYGNAVEELDFVYRPAGTFDHTNTLGMNLVFWLIFVVVTFVKSKKLSFLIIAVIGFFTLTITLSRSAWIGFTTGILLIFFIIEKLKKRQILSNLSGYFIPSAFLFLLLMYKFVLPRAIDSLYSFTGGGGEFRIEQIFAAKEIILAHPLFGIGNNMVILEGLKTNAESILTREAVDIHNWYFSLMVNYGVIVFIIFVVFVILSIKPLVQSLIKSNYINNDFYINVAILGSLLAFFTIGLMSTNSGVQYIILFLGLFNGKKLGV